MIREALEYLQELARPTTLEVYGREYSTVALHPVREPEPETLSTSTLTGFVDYIKSEIDSEIDSAVPYNMSLVHIKNPTTVVFLSSICGDFNQRICLAEAKPDLPDAFPFGKYFDPDTFMVMLQTRLARTGDWEEAVKLCSSIKIEDGSEITDTGASQEVVVKKGISLAGRKTIKNPLELAPFRTFPEIEQPISQFILRVDNTGRLMLAEADGGAWRLAAMKSIKTCLDNCLDGKGITILA